MSPVVYHIVSIAAAGIGSLRSAHPPTLPKLRAPTNVDCSISSQLKRFERVCSQPDLTLEAHTCQMNIYVPGYKG